MELDKMQIKFAASHTPPAPDMYAKYVCNQIEVQEQLQVLQEQVYSALVVQLIRTIDFRLPRMCVCVCGRKEEAAGREGGR